MSTSIRRRVFHERSWARLPKGRPIEVASGGDWSFPAGAMVAHELRFNDRDETLFEMRVIEKFDGKSWGYGAYTLSGDRLVLRKTSDQLALSFVLIDRQAKPMKIRLKTIPQMACARCHSSAGLGTSAVDYAEEAGPCEFQPGNPLLRSAWADSFLKSQGWSPFKQQN